MKTNKDLLRRVRQGCWSVALLSACMVNFTSCDKYDLDEQDPAGWGASIYNYLEESGNFNNTKRLIEDLGLKEVLAKTGSKTLFAANDEAFDRFYANNSWGVKNYDQLSLSQKKLLLNGSMIDNSYQVNDLSSVENRIEGMCMRRFSSQSIMDSVAVVDVNDLPNMQLGDDRYNPLWAMYSKRPNGKMYLMQDATKAPMLHFIEQQMVNNKITNADYDFLYNHQTHRQAGDASVNGVQITRQNIKCSNGFVHEMADVVMPLPNMAEVIRGHSELSEYDRLLERFSAPHYLGKDMTEQYNYQYHTNIDSLFQKRFFASKSQRKDGTYMNYYADVHGTNLVIPDVNEDNLLVFDPEWNSYFTGSTNGASEEERMKTDMAVMLVPSNTAMTNFWNAPSGPGKVLREQYGSLINVPNKVILKLLNNNMLVSFVNSVPSKFGNILNSNNDPMGITENDIEKVYLANNGAVYVTNKVFSPTEYVSVLYPSTVNQNMSIMEWAITKNEYSVYLNSLQAYYSIFIHTNRTLDYLDPLSVMKGSPQVYRFHYDAARHDDSGSLKPVYASIHPYEDGFIGDSIAVNENEDQLKLRLRDILDASIVVNEDIEDGNTFYRTMGYQPIKVKVNGGSTDTNPLITVMGGQQINEEANNPISVAQVYNQTKDKNGEGNGKCYVIDNSEPIMGTFKSVINILDEHDEFSEFAEFVKSCGILENIHEKKYYSMHDDGNISTFNTYHYTVYVPTNSAIQQWKRDNNIPDDLWNSQWDDENFKNANESSDDPNDKQYFAYKKMRTAVLEFVKYHIQDNALMIGSKPVAAKNYGTSLIKNDMFQKVQATLTKTGIDVVGIDKSQKETGAMRHVVKDNNLYNLIAREYYFEEEWNSDGAKSKMDCNKLFTTSSAVIHQIDGVLVNK